MCAAKISWTDYGNLNSLLCKIAVRFLFLVTCVNSEMSLQLTGFLEAFLTLRTLVYWGLGLFGSSTGCCVDTHVFLQMTSSFKSFMANLLINENFQSTFFSVLERTCWLLLYWLTHHFPKQVDTNFHTMSWQSYNTECFNSIPQRKLTNNTSKIWNITLIPWINFQQLPMIAESWLRQYDSMYYCYQ